MAEINKMLIKSLTKIRNQINNLDIEDQEAIIQIGASLEEVFVQIPEDFSGFSSLLEKCLVGLQAIYEKTVKDQHSLSHAIASATVALEQVILSPDNPVCQHMLKQANALLTKLLNSEDKEQDPLPSITNMPLSQSVEVILNLFSSLIPSDPTSLIQFKAALMKFTDDNSESSQVLCLKEALNVLNTIITGQAKDLNEAIEKIKKLLNSLQTSSINQTDLANQVSLQEQENLRKEIIDESNNVDSSKEIQIKEVTKEIVREAVREAVKEAVREAVKEEKNDRNQENTRLIDLPKDRDDKLLAEFIAESQDYIESAEAALLSLETDPNNLEAINTVFRAFHTIKGTSSLLGISTLSKLAHQAESLLSRIRDNKISFSEKYADLAFASTDMIKVLLERLRKALAGEKVLKPTKYTCLIEVLKDLELLEENTYKEKQEEEQQEKQDIKQEEKQDVKEEIQQKPKQETKSPNYVNKPSRELIDKNIDELKHKVTVIEQKTRAISLSTDISTNQESLNKNSSEESFIRVKTDKLDRLIDLIGELVISHSMLSQDNSISTGEESDLTRKIADSGKIVRELQDLSMTIRMVPLKTSFQKLNRLVRDLAHKSGKNVDFLISGEDTEIDRHMVSFITDPLVHMVRNAIDHGIESPEDREAKGKPRSGKVQLRAYHAGGNVVVELQDDGRGLDSNKILQKALDKGLVKSSEGLSEADIFKLIFVPGFSTAEQLTDISGRGVGMDVVKRNIEALHGTIEISSELGKGTIFSLNLPLTLAITDGMLVRVGKERYILPTLSIFLSFCPKATMLSTVVGQGEMVMLRGELMPIFRLHRLFDIPDAIEDPTKALLIVVADGKRRCALLVDELLGQQQVVTKSLGSNLGKITGISGGTILGDGCVGLMLDVGEIISLAKTTPNKAFSRTTNEANCINLPVKRSDSMITEKTEKQNNNLGGKYLTFFLSNEEYGIEILKVQEIIGLMQITRIPQTPHFIKGVVNLRGKVITVIDLRLKFNLPEQTPTPETCIIVVQTGGVEMGIIVDKVSEVLAISNREIENVSSFGMSINTDFLLGVSKAQDNVRLLLDIDQILSVKEIQTISNLSTENNFKHSNEINSSNYVAV